MVLEFSFGFPQNMDQSKMLFKSLRNHYLKLSTSAFDKHLQLLSCVWLLPVLINSVIALGSQVILLIWHNIQYEKKNLYFYDDLHQDLLIRGDKHFCYNAS